MDSGSDGLRQQQIQACKSDNMEITKEPVEENITKILSPELHDVFPIFANMLDIKSFMKLAMTSKNMYKRCMEDKAIKINVEEEYSFEVYNNDGVPGFSIKSSLVSKESLVGSYLTTLRKQQFDLTLNELEIRVKTNKSIINAVCNYMEDFGVKRITLLKISPAFVEWDAIVPFIKKFDVKKVAIFARRHVSFQIARSVPLDILRSILQLDLEEFTFGGSVPIDFLLELESPIPIITFHGKQRIEKDKFMQLLWKIQTGSLQQLFLDSDSVDFRLYDALSFNRKDPLPDERPLVFSRKDEPYSWSPREYFFLHWQAGVTKCISRTFNDLLKIFKCPRSSFPPILRSEEEVMNDLSKRVPEIGCFYSQFDSFAESFSFVDSSFNGPFPTERPLYFKASQAFWELDENDRLMECVWNSNQATWKPFVGGMQSKRIGHPALAKFLFHKRIQESDAGYFTFHCDGPAEFDSWFDGFIKLDFEHSGPLPKDRPLVFERPPTLKRKEKFYVVLFEDRLLQCELSPTVLSVYVTPCRPWNRPPILIDEQSAKEIFQKPPRNELINGLTIRMALETFRACWEFVKTSPRKTEWHHRKTLPCVFETTSGRNDDKEAIERHWICIDGCVYEFSWKDGRAMFSKADPRKIPFEFAKELIHNFAQTEIGTIDDFCMDLEQLRSCFEPFEKVPADYKGPLTRNSHLVLEDTSIRHSCRRGHAICMTGHTLGGLDGCTCSDVFYRFWLIWEGAKVTYCSWGEINPRAVLVEHRDVREAPPILLSKELLRNMVETTLDDIFVKSWYGNQSEYLAAFEGYTKISPNHEGPLPEERPLVVEADAYDENRRYVLREDGIIIECNWEFDHACYMIVYPFSKDIPTVLKPSL